MSLHSLVYLRADSFSDLVSAPIDTIVFVPDAGRGTAYYHDGSDWVPIADRLITNEGTVGIQVENLPTAALGLVFTYYVQDADGFQINAAAGDTIRLSGSVSATAGSISSTSVGSAVTLNAINDTEWVASFVTGTWVIT